MKHTRHTKADKLQPHQDRFAGLLWDCKEIILRHLTRHDLAQCEQVNKVWQSLVHEWIIAPNGYCMLFPESWRLKMQAGANDDEKVRRVKDVDVRYTRYTKLRSGRASSGRVIGTEIDIREWSRAVVEGDFAAWLGTDWIFTQRLGFQPDGSLYPIRKLYNPCSEADECSLRLSPCGSVLLCSSRSIIPSPDAARRTLLYGRPIWDRITSQSDHGARDQVYALSTETGWYLWKREAPIFTELIIGVGETRVYSLRREPGCEPLKFLVTQDLYSGAVLNTVSIQNDALECALAGICCVRQLNGKDVLVTFNAQYQPRQPPDTLPYPIMLTSGHIQIIRPEYGTIIQTIESNRCNSANPDMRIMPSPMNAEDFAFVCRGPERGGCHGYKVYKLSPHATGGSRGRKKGKKYKYHITSTEVIKFNTLHVYPVGVDIDPFRNLFVVMASSFDAPLILPMEELTAPFGGKAARHDGLDLDLDLALEGHVDKWLASGPGSAITLLRTREKKVDYEILTIRDTPTLCCIPKVCFAGRDKVLIYTGVQQYLFDFAFRNHRRYTMRNKPGRIKELGGIGELEDGRGRLKSRYAYDA